MNVQIGEGTDPKESFQRDVLNSNKNLYILSFSLYISKISLGECMKYQRAEENYNQDLNVCSS